MRSALLLLLFISILLSPAVIVAGENAPNVSNKVIVNSSQTTVNSTDIKIETNGDVKTFHAEGNEDIDWQSDDGSTKVSVNNEGLNNVNIQVNQTGDTIPSEPIVTPSPFFLPDALVVKEDKEEDLQFFEILQKNLEDFLKSLFA